MMQPKRDTTNLRRESHSVLKQMLVMIDQSPELDIQQFALEAIVRLTGSTGGFIHAIDQEGAVAHLENTVNPSPTSRPVSATNPEPLSSPGPWSAFLDADHRDICSLKKSTIQGLGSIEHGLATAIRTKGQLVAVMGVTNCATPYQDLDREILRELASGLGRVVLRKHLHDRMPDDLK